MYVPPYVCMYLRQTPAVCETRMHAYVHSCMYEYEDIHIAIYVYIYIYIYIYACIHDKACIIYGPARFCQG
jgi:hypothetical protein